MFNSLENRIKTGVSNILPCYIKPTVNKV